MKIRVYVSTNYVGSECSDELEVDDDCTDDDLDDIARDWMFEQIEWGWDKVADKDN